MSVNDELLRKSFGKNLALYRKKAGLTQKDLAEKLNYSDKLVSKWERGEGIPDLLVAANVAELLGVTLNDLVSEKTVTPVTPNHNKIITVLLSCGMAWLSATVLFFFFTIIGQNIFTPWLLFIYAIPVCAIILVVFTNIWWGKILRFLSVSLLIWSVPLSIVLSLSAIDGISFLFIIAAVVQILTIFWFLLKKQKLSGK